MTIYRILPVCYPECTHACMSPFPNTFYTPWKMSILAQSNCMQPRNSPESCQYNMPICDTAIQWHHLHSGRTLYYLQHSAGLIRDSSVDIASRLGGPNAVEIWTFPAGTRDFFPSVKHPDRLWCPSGLLSYRYPEGLCPSVKRPGPEEDQLSL
jgi:hypothetical protein